MGGGCDLLGDTRLSSGTLEGGKGKGICDTGRRGVICHLDCI